MNSDINTYQEIKVVDMDMTPKMFLVFPIHFPHYTYNKLLQMFLQMRCPQ